MPDPKRLRVYYEGDDDRNVLEGLERADLLPSNCEIAKRDKTRPGQEGMIQDLIPFVRPDDGVGGSAIALIDLDDRKIQDMGPWVQGRLQKYLLPNTAITVATQNPRVSIFRVAGTKRASQVAFVAVGLPEDSRLRQEHGVVRFAVDDYLLNLVRAPDVYSSVSELEGVSFEKAMSKLHAMTGMLRSNEIPVEHSKRLLHLLRAITNFRPSSAEFVRRLLEKALDTLGSDGIREIFQPLIEDIQESARTLLGSR